MKEFNLLDLETDYKILTLIDLNDLIAVTAWWHKSSLRFCITWWLSGSPYYPVNSDGWCTICQTMHIIRKGKIEIK